MQYETYWQIDAAVDELFATQQYDDAIALLDQGAALFPDYAFDGLSYKLAILLAAKRYDDVLTALEHGLDQGFFYSLGAGFDPIRESGRFNTIETESERLKAQAKVTAAMKYDVHTPPDYTPGRAYPVFLSLHGDTMYLDSHRQFWPPDALLGQGYIVVYVQSPMVVATKGFVWTTDYARTREAVKACYEQVVTGYSIDQDQVVIGGFSGGAIAAIEVVLSGVIPARGFVALCPDEKPESCTPEHARQAAQRGVRGVMLEGEQSGEVPAEQEMLAIFRAADLPCEFMINADIGHWYPPDLDEKVTRSLVFICDGQF